MGKKSLFTAFLLVFGILASSMSYAATSVFSSGFDVSIDRVIVNNQAVSQSRNNLLEDSELFLVQIDITAVKDLQSGHVEVALKGKQSGDVVADATPTFDLIEGKTTTLFLALALNEGIEKEDNYELTVKVVNARGSSEQKTYGIKTERSALQKGLLDVSIDRVKVNNKVVAASSSNFIEESNTLDVLVEFTAVEKLQNAHIEAILKDLNSGKAIADASQNFNLAKDSSSSKSLKLELLDKLKKSDSFELTIRVVDAERNSIKQVYGISMKGNGAAKGLDVSLDSVETDDEVLAENQNNFVVIGENEKELDLRVRFTALESVKDARVDAILTFSNGDVVADTTPTFNLTKDEKAVKNLNLPLISKFSQNNFRLKVVIKDSDGDFIERSYGLKVSQQKLPFFITDIALSPESNLQAGKSLGITLTIRQSGIVPLDGVSARVSIPGLDTSSTKFLSQDSKEEIKKEFILKIPDNAEGTYNLKAEVISQFSSSKTVREITFLVKGKGEAAEFTNELFTEVPIGKQDIRNDGTEVIYPITLTNDGQKTNAYTVTFDGLNWANLRLSDSNAFVLGPKEAKTLLIYASTKAKVSGEKAFLVNIKSNGKIVRQIGLKANVVPMSKSTGIFTAANLKESIKVMLILAIIALAAVGGFHWFKSLLREDKEGAYQKIANEIPDKVEGEAYY